MRMRATITCIRMGMTLTICSLVFAVSAFAQDPKPTGHWAFVDITETDKGGSLKNDYYPSSLTGKRGALQTKTSAVKDGDKNVIAWTVTTDWTWSDPPGVLVPGELVTVRLGCQGSDHKDAGLGRLWPAFAKTDWVNSDTGWAAAGLASFYPKTYLESDRVTLKKEITPDSSQLTHRGIEGKDGKLIPLKSDDFIGKVPDYQGDPRQGQPGKWMSIRVVTWHHFARTYYYNYKWVEGSPPKEGIKIPPPVDEGTTSGSTTGHGSTSQPPAGTVEPANTTKFTIQAGKRTAKSGETVQVPVFLLNPSGVGNLNTTVSYTSSVATAEGKPIRGNVLGSALFEANAAEAGIARVGVAGSKPLTESGILAHITFKAVGKPGDRTILKVAVTTANANDGKSMLAETIDGEVIIVGEGGKIPGDQDGDGEITASDALSALKMSVKLIPENMTLDMDKDTKVTSNDARLILLKAVGK